jgi:hypothetical protein
MMRFLSRSYQLRGGKRNRRELRGERVFYATHALGSTSMPSTTFKIAQSLIWVNGGY